MPAGATATFFTTVKRSWPLQWHTNGVPVPGATQTSFTTGPVTAANADIVYTVAISGCETSTPVHAVVFKPSATKSIGINFIRSGAPAPGFYRGTSTDPKNLSIANFVRFDNVKPDGWRCHGQYGHLGCCRAGDRGQWIQLVLNAPNPRAPPAITTNPQ